MDKDEKLAEDCLEVVRRAFDLSKDDESDSYSIVFWWRYLYTFCEDQKAAGKTNRQVVALFKRKVKAFLSTK